MLLSCVVIFNSSTPQTRKEDVVEDLQVQGQVSSHWWIGLNTHL